MILEKGVEMILAQTGTASRNLQSCEDFHVSYIGMHLPCYRQVKLAPQSSGLYLGSFWRLIRCDVFVDKTSASVVMGESEAFIFSYCDQFILPQRTVLQS